MRVILVANPKGGCGKTTIATNLACFYARWGLHPILLDADAQCSSSDWQTTRDRSLPRVTVTSTTMERLPEHLRQARARAIAETLVIVDLPAAFPIAAELDVLSLSHLALWPMLASPIDTRAMVHHLFDLHKHDFDGVRAPVVGVVANRVRPHTRLQRELTEGFFQRIRFPLVGELRDTVNYPTAAERGMGIVELPARQVIKDLLQWQGILEWINGRLWPEKKLDVGALLD